QAAPIGADRGDLGGGQRVFIVGEARRERLQAAGVVGAVAFPQVDGQVNRRRNRISPRPPAQLDGIRGRRGEAEIRQCALVGTGAAPECADVVVGDRIGGGVGFVDERI